MSEKGWLSKKSKKTDTVSKGSQLLKTRWLGRKAEEDNAIKEKKILESMDSLISLSKHSILSKLNGSEDFEKYVKGQEEIDFKNTKKQWSSINSGVRVSLFVDNELRGGYGTLKSDKNVYEDVIEYSVQAATNDNRFPPINWKEFKKLQIEISLIDEDEYPIEYTDPLELCMILDKDKEKGVLIRHPKGRQAYFLPDTWDLIPDPAMFLSSLCVNAGLPSASWRGEKRLWPRKITEKKRNLYTGKVVEPEEFSGVSIYHLKVISTVGDGKS